MDVPRGIFLLNWPIRDNWDDDPAKLKIQVTRHVQPEFAGCFGKYLSIRFGIEYSRQCIPVRSCITCRWNTLFLGISENELCLRFALHYLRFVNTFGQYLPGMHILTFRYLCLGYQKSPIFRMHLVGMLDILF